MRILNLNNMQPSTLYPYKVTYITAMGDCMRRAGCDVDDDGIRYMRPPRLWRKAAAYARLWWRCATRDLSGYDAVYVSHAPFCWPVLLNRSLSGRKLYLHWHGNDLVGRGAARLLRLMLRGSALRRAVHVVPSAYFAAELAARYPAAAGRTVVSPSGGVDTDIFKPGKSPGRFVIGFPGELTAPKGAAIFASLMERHSEIETAIGREVEFAVIDYGAEAGLWIERYRATGARLRIFDKMPRSQMPGFYTSLSMAAVLSERESLGLVALEAMSCGLPVLAQEVCAFPEFVRPGLSGELVAADVSPDILVDRTIAIARGRYNPWPVVEAEYSREAVTECYRNLFA